MRKLLLFALMCGHVFAQNQTGPVNFPSTVTVSTTLLPASLPVSVLAYGAVGDCSTNDTAAIQAAFDTGKAVKIPNPPAGACYKITDELVLKTPSQFVQGDSGGYTGTTVIKQFTANKNGIRVQCTPSPCVSGPILDNFNIIDASTGSTSGVGLYFTGTSLTWNGDDARIGNVSIQGFTTKIWFDSWGLTKINWLDLRYGVTSKDGPMLKQTGGSSNSWIIERLYVQCDPAKNQSAVSLVSGVGYSIRLGDTNNCTNQVLVGDGSDAAKAYIHLADTETPLGALVKVASNSVAVVDTLGFQGSYTPNESPFVNNGGALTLIGTVPISNTASYPLITQTVNGQSRVYSAFSNTQLTSTGGGPGNQLLDRNSELVAVGSVPVVGDNATPTPASGVRGQPYFVATRAASAADDQYLICYRQAAGTFVCPDLLHPTILGASPTFTGTMTGPAITTTGIVRADGGLRIPGGTNVTLDGGSGQNYISKASTLIDFFCGNRDCMALPFTGGIQNFTVTPPTCTSGLEGTQYYVSGTPALLKMCGKKADGTYALLTISTWP